MKSIKLSILFYLISLFFMLPASYFILPAFGEDRLWRHTTLLAQESSPTASPSATLQSKLKLLQEEIASKAVELKKEISQKLQNKAIIGPIKSKTDTSLTIATKEGTSIVSIKDFTEFVNPQVKKKPSLENLNPEEYIIVLGDIDDTNVLTAKKIISTNPPDEENNKQIVWGKITSITPTSLHLETKEKETKTFSLDKKTKYLLENEDTDFSTLKVGKNVFIVGVLNQKEILRGRFIYIFPNVSSSVSDSSPSASISPKTSSPSGKTK